MLFQNTGKNAAQNATTTIFIFLLSFLISQTASALSCTNYFILRGFPSVLGKSPFEEKSPLGNGVYPQFDLIRVEHFIPALLEARVKAEALLNEIRNEKKPTFESVILKLEKVSTLFGQPLSVFSIYSSSFKTAEIKAIEEAFSEIKTQFFNELSMDLTLFAKIKEVYKQKDALAPDQKLLVEDSYKNFVRSGAELPAEQKKRLTEINEQLSKLSISFEDNVMEYKAGHFVHVADVAQLKGVPEDLIEAFKADAEEKNLNGYVIYPVGSMVRAVLEKAASESLRKELYLLSGQTGYAKNKFNNEDTLKNIAQLKLERAQLLGYKHHADFVLETRMAKNFATVNDFLESLRQKYTPKAEEENRKLAEFKKQRTGSADMEAWDRSYWMDQYTTAKVSLDRELFRDYLLYENVRKGLFDIFKEIYGLEFIVRPDLPRLDPDMEVYEVRSEKKDLYGFVMIDMYNRKIKSGGAWMNQIVTSYQSEGQRIPALVTVNLNVKKPENANPTLLTLDEGVTFFHEFGHALHGLLTQARYASQSGTNVKWDFVELPSQVTENLFRDPQRLAKFAVHYKTGASIPTEYVQKLIDIDQMFSGNYGLRQIALARLDLAWHTGEALQLPGTLSEIDNSIINSVVAFKNTQDVSTSTSFTHIFSGGYSAGYYSYKWAEVLDADAYAIIKRQGIHASRAFLRFILEKGGSVDPKDAYLSFAGSPATLEALLIREGIQKALNVSKTDKNIELALLYAKPGQTFTGIFKFSQDASKAIESLKAQGVEVNHVAAEIWAFRNATKEAVVFASHLPEVVSIQSGPMGPPTLF